jgi:hypothetical protein
MAILNITELKELAKDNMDRYVPVGNHAAATVQEVTGITATPQQSSAFQSTTGFVRLNADVNIRYAVGTNPTAASTSTRLAADVLEVIGVPRNKDYKISVRTA